MLLLLLACAPKHEGAYVRRIHFTGNDQPGILNPLSDAVLRDVITQPYGRSNPTPPDPDVLAEDGRRLEIWLAHKGYFDARFVGWVEHRRPGRRTVTLTGQVELGEPYLVTTVEVDGLDRLSGPIRGRVLDGLSVKEGDVFDRDLYLASMATVPALLQESAYAYARADGEVLVEDHAVTVRIHVDPGPACRFGAIRIVGEDEVAEKRIRDQLTFAEGDGYRTRSLAETRTRLFGMRTFASVAVIPELSDPPSSTVPVRVEVREGKFRGIKAGGYAGYDPGRAWAEAALRFTHNNLAHQAWQFSSETAGGYALAFDLATLQATAGPTLSEAVKLDTPRILGPVGMVHEGKAELGVDLGYGYFDTSYAPALTFQLSRPTILSLGYRAEYFQYIDLSAAGLPASVNSLELNRDGQYLISLLEQRLLYDGRNDPVAPSRGWYATAALGEAGGRWGDYRYLRADLDLRTYKSLLVALGRFLPRAAGDTLRGTTLALRAAGGLIRPYGPEEEAKVPYQERLFLGGGSTVRGWQVDHLGPPCTSCSSDDGSLLPAGGLSELYGSLELRKMGSSSLGGAVFSDFGRSWLDLPLLLAEPIQWSVGGGVRYASPVGPLRLDLALRLGDDPMFKDEPRLALSFGLSELF